MKTKEDRRWHYKKVWLYLFARTFPTVACIRNESLVKRRKARKIFDAFKKRTLAQLS